MKYLLESFCFEYILENIPQKTIFFWLLLRLGNLFPLLINCHDVSDKLLFLLKNLVISELFTEFVLFSFFFIFLKSSINRLFKS